MKDNIFLSIVIPMYNTERHITKCLESLNNQTIKDFEIIIIDDGSSDESYKKAKEYLKDKTLSYSMISQKNLGQSVARNEGIKNAVGRYILFLDSDDFVGNNLVEKTREAAYKQESDLLLFDYKRVKADGTIIPNRQQTFESFKEIKEGIDVFYAYKNNEIRLWTSSLIYNREFILKNNLKYLADCHGAEDLNFIFKSLMKAKKVSFIEDTLSYYYQRVDSLTNSPDIKKNITVVNAMEDVCKFIKKNSLDSKLEEIIKTEFTPEHIMYQLFGYINEENKNEVINYLKEPKIKTYLKRCKYDTTRYGKKAFVWMKFACYFPSKFSSEYLKRKG
ncbi:beta-1,3-N-acetylglucosaminyltransferase [Clostridium polyendosporum]|uniref:Beta-1,3-N-acetylglucosaminyltransferase n=1 Tax=Clostridium polyendosporum TaxID=69208 RepID=A0A919RZQ9_9CLOT|nr:glycosyltransferase family A protein [Clostridium polyendosporum]GIM29301.1 beta-1,3-N-acetylglucosaminyltransferase [Clostridium polyendosporum]